MRHLACPFCGPRELREFEFHKTLPEPGGSFFAQVYERIDRPDDSREYWQHVEGCRAWLVIRRNPSSGTVLETRIVGGAAS